MFPYPFSFLGTTESGLDQLDNDYYMEFDGVDDYIQVASTSDAIIDFSNPWSVSWWAKWTYTAGFDLFWQFGKTSATLRYVGAWINGTSVGWSVSAATSSTVYYNLGGTLNDGDWHHFVLTGTGASGNGTLYIDGSLNTDTPTSTGAVFADATNNNIGRGYATTGRFFDGDMDEVAIWDSELSAADITAIYDATDIVGKKCADLSSMTTPPVAWYRMGD